MWCRHCAQKAGVLVVVGWPLVLAPGAWWPRPGLAAGRGAFAAVNHRFLLSVSMHEI